MINKDLLYNNILIRLYMLNPREFKKMISKLLKEFSEDTIIMILEKYNNI